MRDQRRRFLWYACALSAGAMSRILPEAQGQSRKMPTPPEPAETAPPISGRPGSRASQRAILEQHEKQFRESLASLSERVNELKVEIEQLHSSEIFSVKIYKETSEIEHLAKQLKTLAKS